MKIEEFKIAVPDTELSDLAYRLDHTRWPGPVEGVNWSYGTNLDYLKSFVAYWRTRFDWRTVEQELNRLPQFRADIDGCGVHFIHVKGKGPAPLPIVITHGWPSSFIEWKKIIGPLSDPAAHGGDAADAFDVIVPSLPGYGFSDIATKPGMTPRLMAAMWVKLMEALGYCRFAAHGCDWGAYVTSLMGLDFPDRLVGIHTSMVSLSAARDPAKPRMRDESYSAARRSFRDRETGYSAIQGTKPQTLAYGLTDSPAGLAGWIVEKWRAWTDCNGDLDSVIDRDTVLTNIAIYWFTRTINSACRIYLESRRNPVELALGQRVEVPCGFFLEGRPVGRPNPDGTRRIGAPPRERAEGAFNIQRWFLAPRGGHFPALEVPDMLVDELRAFFRPLRKS